MFSKILSFFMNSSFKETLSDGIIHGVVEEFKLSLQRKHPELEESLESIGELLKAELDRLI